MKKSNKRTPTPAETRKVEKARAIRNVELWRTVIVAVVEATRLVIDLLMK